jgi:hypothetical protein
MVVARAFEQRLNAEIIKSPPHTNNADEDERIQREHLEFIDSIGGNLIKFTPLDTEDTSVEVFRNQASKQTEINTRERYCLPLINRREEENRPTMSFLKRNLELQFCLSVSSTILGGTKQVINETPDGMIMHITSSDAESANFFADLFSHRPFQKRDVLEYTRKKLIIGANVLQRRMEEARKTENDAEYYQILLSKLLLISEIRKHQLLNNEQKQTIIDHIPLESEHILAAFNHSFEYAHALEIEQRINTVIDLLRLLANLNPEMRAALLKNPILKARISEAFIPTFKYAFRLREEPLYSTLNDLLRLLANLNPETWAELQKYIEILISAFDSAYELAQRNEPKPLTDLLRLLANLNPEVRAALLNHPILKARISEAFIPAFKYAFRLKEKPPYSTFTDLLGLLANLNPEMGDELQKHIEILISAFDSAYELAQRNEPKPLTDLLRLVAAPKPELMKLINSCPDLERRIGHARQWILHPHQQQHTSVQNDGSDGCPVIPQTSPPPATAATCSYSSSPPATSTSSACLEQAQLPL